MIRQDHRGRLYRIVYFDNVITGQRTSVELPYTPSDAPPARMIPVQEPALPRPKLKGPMRVRGSNGQLRDFKPHQSKRMHVVELRKVGAGFGIKEVSPNGSNGLAAFIDSTILRFDGKNWLSLFPPVVDWHVQYHIDEENNNG